MITGSVFGFFLIAAFLLFKRQKAGYALMLAFLSVEFPFYLWGMIGSMISWLSNFFQMSNPDVLLRSVFFIGYLNFVASGYFLILLLRYKHYFQTT